MGMYTQLVLGVELKSNTPVDVIAMLAYMAGEREAPPPFSHLPQSKECDVTTYVPHQYGHSLVVAT